MNNARRKTLAAILEQIDAAASELETVADEEREAFDNMPEGLQASEKGAAIGNNADELEAIRDELADLVNRINEVMGE